MVPRAIGCTWPATRHARRHPAGGLHAAGQRRRPAHLDALADLVAAALGQQPGGDERHPEPRRRRAGGRVLGTRQPGTNTRACTSSRRRVTRARRTG